MTWWEGCIIHSQGEPEGGLLYGYYLRTALHYLKTHLDERLAPFGITGQQARILGYIHLHEERGQPIRQKDLEEDMGLRGSSVTSLLQGLEKRGFLLRCHGDGDGRVKRLTMTEKGRGLHETFHEIMSSMEEEIVVGMSMRERRVFLRLLKRASENLTRTMPVDRPPDHDPHILRKNRDEVDNEQEIERKDK